MEPQFRFWTAAETLRLTQLWHDGVPAPAIAHLLNRAVGTIRAKASSLKLPARASGYFRNRDPFTPMPHRPHHKSKRGA